jgi:hypothetical protein
VFKSGPWSAPGFQQLGGAQRIHHGVQRMSGMHATEVPRKWAEQVGFGCDHLHLAWRTMLGLSKTVVHSGVSLLTVPMAA